MTLQEFEAKIKEFLTFITQERNLSAHTQRAYSLDLTQCATFWHSLHEKDELTLRRVIERYLMALFYKKIQKSSIARKFSCFKSFERFLKSQSIVLNLQLKRPRVEKKLPIYLTPKEITLLLDQITNQQLLTSFPIRDRTILEILYATGVRASELVNIKLCDINMNEKTIKIMGKGRKERIVLFGQKAQEQIERYIQLERIPIRSSDDPLLLNNRMQKIDTRTIQRVIAMFRTFLPIQRPITPHKIRHTFATHLVGQGADLRVVQELLGHKSLESTERYTHVTVAQLQQMCATKHPINTIGSIDKNQVPTDDQLPKKKQGSDE